MARHEQPPPAEGPHFNPEVTRWEIPEEGLAIQLQIATEIMASLDREEREQLTYALGNFAQLCDYLLAQQPVETREGESLAQRLRSVGGFVRDLHHFYQMIAGDLEPTRAEEVPF